MKRIYLGFVTMLYDLVFNPRQATSVKYFMAS